MKTIILKILILSFMRFWNAAVANIVKGGVRLLSQFVSQPMHQYILLKLFSIDSCFQF